MFNATIAPQLEEFNNANLLFAAMDKHVWTKASQDSAGYSNIIPQTSKIIFGRRVQMR